MQDLESSQRFNLQQSPNAALIEQRLRVEGSSTESIRASARFLSWNS